MLELVMIACAAKNDVIGRGPEIPWSIREDFRHFSDLTMGFPCLMGDVTYESLPMKYRPLPGRENIVLSLDPEYEPDGVTLFRDFHQALAYVRGLPTERAFICGGATIYRLGMAVADILEITRLDRVYKGDSTFPTIDGKIWELTQSTPASGLDRISGEHVSFTYQTWRRR